MQTLWQDLRFGARMLLKQPGFTLIAVLTLSLGIGATTALFTIINAALLRPLPYPDAERLVQLGRAFTGDKEVSSLSAAKLNFIRGNAQSFAALTATQEMGANTALSDASQAEYVSRCFVTRDFFRTLSVAPALGREFSAVEDSPTGERVAILSDGLWRRRFGADAAIIGRQITLDNTTHTVVGVMPFGFAYLGAQDVFAPARLSPANQHEGHNWTVIARLKDGVTPAQAQAEMNLLFDRFRQAYPKQVDGGGKESFGLRNWRANLTSGVSDLLWILFGAVGFVLLIGCVNVTNLQLTRAAARRKEIAIRRALGAGSGRLLRQLLTEGVLLAGLGGLAGLLLAVWGVDALLALVPEGMLPRAGEIELDGRVLFFALGASLLAGVIAGLVPALQTLRVDVNRHLKEGAQPGQTESSRGRLRNALVVVEVALALTLTIGAGLLLRTFANLRGVAPGFDAAGVLTFEVSARGERYNTMAQKNELYGRVLERLRSLPGVESVALTNKLPLDSRFNFPYRLPGEANKYSGSAEYRLISPAWFQVMKMALRQGRLFAESDGAGAEPVLIVNEAFARKHFSNREALGQQVAVCCGERGELALRRVVGVVNDTKQRSLGEAAPATVFIPLWQATEEMKGFAQQTSFALRTAGEPLALSAAIRNELKQLDPALLFRHLRSMEQLVNRSVASQRFNLTLLGLFAALGLLLSVIGIYGVMAYGVAQRTHEIGLRIALGAQARDVLQPIVAQGMKLTLFGVALGLLAAWGLTRMLKTLLFGVSATDPPTFGAVAALLFAAALLACWLPARRATKVDPLIALRA